MNIEEQYKSDKIAGKLKSFFQLTDSYPPMWYSTDKLKNGFYRYLNTGEFRPFILRNETFDEYKARIEQSSEKEETTGEIKC